MNLKVREPVDRLIERQPGCQEMCPMQVAVRIIGGKWKPVILYKLADGTLRFGVLHRAIDNITQRMLTLQLRELERDGLVARKVFAQVPPRVEYSLTSAGEEMVDALRPLADWGNRHLAANPATG
ncbi:MAG: helix-turn-helix transcriptional regulator [Alphaproteobacteria bacterium]|nr:helix-turn-helix transcriptional regulator [Alphaproteobacteria bacterium]